MARFATARSEEAKLLGSLVRSGTLDPPILRLQQEKKRALDGILGALDPELEGFNAIVDQAVSERAAISDPKLKDAVYAFLERLSAGAFVAFYGRIGERGTFGKAPVLEDHLPPGVVSAVNVGDLLPRDEPKRRPR